MPPDAGCIHQYRLPVVGVDYNGDMNRALFLDRDGVIVENRTDYIRSWEDVLFLPGSLEALAKLTHASIKIIIVTNQSVVGRGIISMETAEAIHHRILQTIELAGGRVDDTFMCPHAPDEECPCRKPKPGLFLQAAEKHNLDMMGSICIGDALSDLQAAIAAGVGTRILVCAGRGKDQLKLPEMGRLPPFLVFSTLAQAIAHFPPGFLPSL